MECPNPDFKKNLEDNLDGVKRTLYGPDGKSGITACVQKKVSWKALSGIVIPLVVIIVGANYRIHDKAECALRERTDNKKQIELIQKDLDHIKNTNERLENGQEVIKKEIQEIRENRMTPEMFRRILRNEIKKN